MEEIEMITREEFISNDENWITTENLDLDCFDYIFNNFGGSYYLKKKNKDEIYFGHYIPKYKSFECYKLQDPNKIIIKREDISYFISLPPLDFEICLE